MAMLRETSIVTPLTMVVILVMLTDVASSVRYVVGGSQGWRPNVNYTIWAQDKHFYTEDWLFFEYDRKQYDVLEVSKTNYESCSADHPLHNYTTGAGGDMVALNQTRNFYFITTSKSACYAGMKVALIVAPPVKDDAPASTYHRGNIIFPVFFTIAFMLGSLFRIW